MKHIDRIMHAKVRFSDALVVGVLFFIMLYLFLWGEVLEPLAKKQAYEDAIRGGNFCFGDKKTPTGEGVYRCYTVKPAPLTIQEQMMY